MQKLTHDMVVHFRAPSFIMKEAERKAASRGMSVSELLRQALRREVLEVA